MKQYQTIRERSDDVSEEIGIEAYENIERDMDTLQSEWKENGADWLIENAHTIYHMTRIYDVFCENPPTFGAYDCETVAILRFPIETVFCLIDDSVGMENVGPNELNTFIRLAVETIGKEI